jgi:hypothetical protein
VFVFKAVRLTALVKDPKLYNLTLQEIYVMSRKKRIRRAFPEYLIRARQLETVFCQREGKLFITAAIRARHRKIILANIAEHSSL